MAIRRFPQYGAAKFMNGEVDTYPIIPVRVKVPPGKHLRGYRRRTHETCNQDFDPDGRTRGHIYRSSRPTGSRLGRRPASSVPTQTTTLFNYACTRSKRESDDNRKVTKVTSSR